MSMNQYKFLQVIKAKDEEVLLAMLKGIQIPMSVVSIYFDGSYHIAWVNIAGPYEVNKKVTIK